MSYKKRLKTSFRILSNPEKEFLNMKNTTLELIIEDYIKLLLLSGFLAALMSFIIELVIAYYLYLFKGIQINFFKLANYSIGTSVSTFFLYLFFGTAIVFLLTVIINIFARDIKYTNVINLTLYSLTPFLLFSWIYPPAALALIVWCLFLVVTGIKTLRKNIKIHRK